MGTAGLEALEYSMFEEAKQEAIKISRTSKCQRRVGAVIYRGNKILAKGCNVDKTHPRWGSGFHGKFHAETRALYIAYKNKVNLYGASIFVYRENEFGAAMAKPCLRCYEQLIRAGIVEIHYSGSNKDRADSLYKELYNY